MEYTVKKLAELAHTTPRTLRWYDQQGLLKPGGVSEGGYRLYGPREVDRLQQILFFRELGFELSAIKEILDAPDFDRGAALRGHLAALRERRAHLDALILTVTKTIETEKGERTMTDQEKFESFKQEKIADNEKKYGAETRARYGDTAVDAANTRFSGLTKEQYGEMETLGGEIQTALEKAVSEKADPAGETGLAIAEMHKRWLSYTWPSYSKEAHAGVAQGYVADARFTAYYDKRVPGCAEFLRDAVLAFTQKR